MYGGTLIYIYIYIYIYTLGPSVWNLPLFVVVASRILRWLLNFGEICASQVVTV